MSSESVPRSAPITEQNLKLQEHDAGIVLEPQQWSIFGDENQRRAQLEAVTREVLIVADHILQNGPNPKRAWAIQEFGPIGLGLTEQPPVRQDNPQLLHTSARMARALMHPQKTRSYELGGFGTPDGGVDLFGNTAASYMFEDHGPRGSGFDDMHWFRHYMQLVVGDRNALSVSLMPFGRPRSVLQPERFKAALLDPDVRAVVGEQTVVVGEQTSPRASQLKYNEKFYDDARPHMLRVGQALVNFQRNARQEALQVEPLAITGHGHAGASAAAYDSAAGLGMQVRLRAYGRPGDDLMLVPGPKEGDYVARHRDGRLLAARALSIEVEMTAPGEYGWEPVPLTTNIPERLRYQAESFQELAEGLRADILEAQQA